MTAKTFRDLRAWQTAYAFKLRVYELIESGPLSNDETLRKQLRESAASAASQISEGFGRFDPVDFARFVKMARASLVECQNHLQDAVDRRSHHKRRAPRVREARQRCVAGDRRAARLLTVAGGEKERGARAAETLRAAGRTKSPYWNTRTPEPRTPEPRTLNREP